MSNIDMNKSSIYKKFRRVTSLWHSIDIRMILDMLIYVAQRLDSQFLGTDIVVMCHCYMSVVGSRIRV